MSLLKTVKKSESQGLKILFIAIAASLAWHVFWLSAIRVVSGPAPKSSVKYSRVAFLGPILSGVSMDLSASPAGRSPLEARYRDTSEALYYSDERFLGGVAPGYEPSDASGKADRDLFSAIDEAVAGEKPEPDFAA